MSQNEVKNRNLDLTIEQLNIINNDKEDDIYDSIDQYLDEECMHNYQDNDNNNKHINRRKVLRDEEVYDEIGIGWW